jgi:hypothetical protein
LTPAAWARANATSTAGMLAAGFGVWGRAAAAARSMLRRTAAIWPGVSDPNRMSPSSRLAANRSVLWFATIQDHSAGFAAAQPSAFVAAARTLRSAAFWRAVARSTAEFLNTSRPEPLHLRQIVP